MSLRHTIPCRRKPYVQAHSSVFTACDYDEGKLAVFHWRGTYPELLLCAECLEYFENDIIAAEWRERRRWKELWGK